MNTLNPYIFDITYCPEYKAIIDKAKALGYDLPTSAERKAQNALVEALINEGIWAKLDELYIAVDSAELNFNLLNWINPNQALTRNDTNNSKVAGQGISVVQNNNTRFLSPINYYLDSGYGFSLNSATAGFEVMGVSPSQGYNTGNVYIGQGPSFIRVLSEVRVHLFNSGYNAFNTSYTNVGLPEVLRTVTRSNDNVRSFENDTLKLNVTISPNSMPNVRYRIMGMSTGGGSIYFRLAYFGSFLTDGEVATFSDLWINYKNSIL